MTFDNLLSSLDAEILRLQQARAILAGAVNSAVFPTSKARRKRVMSEDARKRIAEAQRKRWAAQRGTNKRQN
jgi:hypothetical protein